MISHCFSVILFFIPVKESHWSSFSFAVFFCHFFHRKIRNGKTFFQKKQCRHGFSYWLRWKHEGEKHVRNFFVLSAIFFSIFFRKKNFFCVKKSIFCVKIFFFAWKNQFSIPRVRRMISCGNDRTPDGQLRHARRPRPTDRPHEKPHQSCATQLEVDRKNDSQNTGWSSSLRTWQILYEKKFTKLSEKRYYDHFRTFRRKFSSGQPKKLTVFFSWNFCWQNFLHSTENVKKMCEKNCPKNFHKRLSQKIVKKLSQKIVQKNNLKRIFDHAIFLKFRGMRISVFFRR